jgi:hypothetical protein
MLRRGLILLLLLTASLAVADPVTHLILKDGSYQAITKYEVKGDRVRYYSAERNQWEEVPSELVDWDATKKYESTHKAAADAAAAKEQAEEADEKIDPKDAKTPVVAPNLRLPEGGGVFALDTYHGTPQLVRLVQSSSQSDQHTGAYILLKTVDPLAAQRTTIDLPGAHAKLQLHTPHPVFYLNIETDADTDTGPDAGSAVDRKVDEQRPSSDAYRYEILKLGEKKNLRRLATTYTSAAEDSTDTAKVVPTVGELTPGNIWVRVDPKQDLVPGEYAVVVALGDDRINSYVWDFGINPSAPANPVATATGDKKPAANDAETSKRMKD